MSEKIEMKRIGNETEEDKFLNTEFTYKFRKGYVEVGPEKLCMPEVFEQYYEEIKNFQVRDDDVFITAFPKSGTRWCNEMVWLIVNNLDYETAKTVKTDYRVPRFEQVVLSPQLPHGLKNIAEIAEMESPRCIGTHLHWSLLPNDIVNNVKHPKMIVVLRSPQDVCLSFFYQTQAGLGYNKGFDIFCEMFLGNRLPLGPFWAHVLGNWEQRHRPNILFIKYKEMKENMPSVINKVATFLGKSLTDEQVKKLDEHLSFNSMKNNSAFNFSECLTTHAGNINPYIRAGVVGGHKELMSEAMQKKFEEKTKNIFDSCGLSFE